MNVLNHIFSALLVPLVDYGLRLLDLEQVLVEVDDFELPFRKCIVKNSTY
jgi:hypothetical protein